jgi:UDP:flavonoid glycosyltransferase YjiC (YdhE family)
MARISFLPLPELGHILPTLKMARRLALRGHQVSYLSLIDFEDLVRANGLGFEPIFTRTCPRGTLRRLAESKVHYLDGLLREQDTAADAFAELMAAIGRAGPDLLLIDFVLHDLGLLARQAGVPFALISVVVQKMRRTLIESAPDLTLDHPVLVLCPRAFELPHVAVRPGCHYVEAFVDLERRDAGRSSPAELGRLDPAQPLIYCSLGSHPHDYGEIAAVLFREVIGAARLRPRWQLVLAVGPTLLGEPVLRDLPSNVVAVEWVPQMTLLEKVAVMITHGGLGTVKECIHFGVPMLVFPMAFDQPENAARIVYHGLGLRGAAADIAAGRIVPLIDRILAEPAFSTRVAAMGAAFRQAEESGAAVRVVEGILAAGRIGGSPPGQLPPRLGGERPGQTQAGGFDGHS